MTSDIRQNKLAQAVLERAQEPYMQLPEARFFAILATQLWLHWPPQAMFGSCCSSGGRGLH